jgi:hypothetical protein
MRVVGDAEMDASESGDQIPHTSPNYLIHVIAHRVFPATGCTLRARDARASVQPSSICPTLTLVALAASYDQERR